MLPNLQLSFRISRSAKTIFKQQNLLRLNRAQKATQKTKQKKRPTDNGHPITSYQLLKCATENFKSISLKYYLGYEFVKM